MVDSAANVLLGTLRDLLIDEVKFVSGVSDDVKKAEEDLRTMHALLMEADANRSRSESPTLKNCMDQLKQLASRAENVLEKYAFEVQSRRQGKGLKKKFKRFMCVLGEWCSVHEVGNEISGIRSQLGSLTTELRSISSGGEGSSNSVDQARLRYAHEDDHHFVGMEKDIDDLVLMVKDDSADSKSVTSICGMGGLGKTTMARKIYNHLYIKRHFDCRAWVCVTQQFQAEPILREIFLQIDENKKDEIMKMELQELVRKLHDFLVQKKCLIVIDDIWEAGHWNTLKVALPTKNCKVLLTTRKENIITSHEGHLHKLRFLTEDEGWKLLQKIALSINDDETQVKPFEDIGRKMVRKCGFLPLAISVIGGILYQKRQMVEWEDISDNMDSYLNNEGEGINRDKRVRQILDLSFDALPYYLKPCFLYLACFPEDAEIETKQLYRLWMAEGLVSSEAKGNHESLRDVAERYLSELAFRCMVQVKSQEYNTPHKKFESCRLHDLMHDLCSSKAEEEKFIKHVDISKHQQDIPSSIGSSIHRLAVNVIDQGVKLYGECLDKFKDLRSFLVLGNDGYAPTGNAIMFNSEGCKSLRILSLESLSFKDGEIPSRIGKLIHLKYMSLRYCSKVKRLPRQVCHLPYLQTLDLRVYLRVFDELEVPNDIWKMKRLRHLFLPCRMKVIGGGGKLKLAGLKELETLEGINSMTAQIADIVDLTNLRRLSASIEGDEECLATIVGYMSNPGCPLLETLFSIWSCNLRDVVEKMSMIRSLIWLEIEKCEIGCSFPSLHNLVILRIEDCEIEGDVMDVLGKFPMLQLLRLNGGLGELTEWIFDANSFPQLKYLYLLNVEGLRKWEVEKGAMPKLRYLYITGCRNLEKLPDGLRFISTLESLSCFRMSEELKDRMRRDGGEDYANFSHIPDLEIDSSTDDEV